MTVLEIVLGFALVVALSALWWTYSFMRLNRWDADFYKKLWMEERQFGTDIMRAVNNRESTCQISEPAGRE